MSPVPEQKPMIPAVYPRPSPMSSMYLYCAFQSSEEFSAEDTSCIAMSFLRGSNRSLPEGEDVGLLVGEALADALLDGDADAEGVALRDADGETVGVDSVPLPYTLNSYS